jgi:DNA-binding MarR family transcriptional regulator
VSEQVSEADRNRDFAVAVRAVVFRLRRFGERRMGIDPIPLSEVDVLTHVIDHPGPTVTEVAHALALQPSNVSTTVRQLVGRGLMYREADSRDGRRSRLFAAPQAIADRDRIEEAWTKPISEFLEQLPPDEREAAIRVTGTLMRLADLELPSETADSYPVSGATA